jgi:hypothetical protein
MRMLRDRVAARLCDATQGSTRPNPCRRSGVRVSVASDLSRPGCSSIDSGCDVASQGQRGQTSARHHGRRAGTRAERGRSLLLYGTRPSAHHGCHCLLERVGSARHPRPLSLASWLGGVWVGNVAVFISAPPPRRQRRSPAPAPQSDAVAAARTGTERNCL